MIRRFHISAKRLKNPYFFYDLQRQQGRPANSQYEDPSFAAGHQTFDPLATLSSESMEQRVRRVFGEMGSREESRKEAQAKAITVAGINVPARPEEPTNCCMSGCIDCVWELYKEELDEFRTLRAEARKRLSQPQYNHIKWPAALGKEPPNRGLSNSVTEVDAGNEADADEDIDTGIKVFIETERRIKQRKRKSTSNDNNNNNNNYNNATAQPQKVA